MDAPKTSLRDLAEAAEWLGIILARDENGELLLDENGRVTLVGLLSNDVMWKRIEMEGPPDGF